jgi:hypothetical protein
LILAWDPGATGGYVRLMNDDLIAWGPMPRIGKEWDLDAIRMLTGEASVVLIEHVNAGAVKSRLTAFSFGEGFGALRATAAALRKPTHLVPSQRWQKVMLPGLPPKKKDMKPAARKKEVKAFAKAMALRLRPMDSEKIRKMGDGPIDALLLALYAKQTILR